MELEADIELSDSLRCHGRVPNLHRGFDPIDAFEDDDVAFGCSPYVSK